MFREEIDILRKGKFEIKEYFLFSFFILLFLTFIYAVSLANVSGSFFDGFESGSLSTNNWTNNGTTAWSVNTSSPYAGTYHLFVENTVSESRLNNSINTTGYTNITFSFYAKTLGLDAGEYIAVDWYNGADWVNLMQNQTIASYTLHNYTLSANANNNPNFAILFKCLSNNNGEACYVDNVVVTGSDLIVPNISIISPQNITYNNSSVLVNLSSGDNAKVNATWFTNLSNINETYSAAINKTWNEGSNTIYAFANDSAGNVNSTSISFNVDLVPKVSIIYPLSSVATVFDEYQNVPIILNVSDLSGIHSVIANVTNPLGVSYSLSNFEYSLTSDDFETDTEGTNWVKDNITESDQICYADIDETAPGKVFFSVDGKDGPSMHCAYTSLKKVEGNYDLNLTFNISYIEEDSFFTLRSAESSSLIASGIRAYISIIKQSGQLYYRFAYYNGTETTQTNIPKTDTYGKIRMKKFNSTGIPAFNMYYLNLTSNAWITVYENISLPNTSRIRYIQLKPGSESSSYGKINLTLDDFQISSDNHTFVLFNSTNETGLYNVSIFVNDTGNKINNSETTNFSIAEVNDAPSRPFFESPDVGKSVSGNFTIAWGRVYDEEGDNIQFNVSLLNTDLSTNAVLVTNYGSNATTSYLWDTTAHSDGRYRLRIVVFENESVERLSLNETLGGEFTIDNIPDPVAESSGGSGTGGGCIYDESFDWRCSDWGECIDGKKIRACLEKNNCKNSYGKPETEKKCFKFLKINLDIKEDSIEKSKDLDPVLNCTHSGGDSISLNLTYKIKNKSGKEIYSKNESLVIEDETVITPSFENLNLSDGEYTLSVLVSSENLTEEFEHAFYVEEKEKAFETFLKSIQNFAEENKDKIFLISVIISLGIVAWISEIAFGKIRKSFGKRHFKNYRDKIKNALKKIRYGQYLKTFYADYFHIIRGADGKRN